MRQPKGRSCVEGRREGRALRFDTWELPVRCAYLLWREWRQNVIVSVGCILGRIKNFYELYQLLNVDR